MKINDLLPKVSEQIFAQHLAMWRNMWGGTDQILSRIGDGQLAGAGSDNDIQSSYTYEEQP